MRAVVCGLLVKAAQPRRSDVRAGRRRGPFDGAPLGRQARAVVRKGVSPVQATGREELENGAVLRESDRAQRPETVTIDKSGANLAALDALNAEREALFPIRQIKCLNNIAELDHRAIKRMVRPMMGFKSFRTSSVILSGIKVVHMIRKVQMMGDNNRSFPEQFYSLVI